MCVCRRRGWESPLSHRLTATSSKPAKAFYISIFSPTGRNGCSRFENNNNNHFQQQQEIANLCLTLCRRHKTVFFVFCLQTFDYIWNVPFPKKYDFTLRQIHTAHTHTHTGRRVTAEIERNKKANNRIWKRRKVKRCCNGNTWSVCIHLNFSIPYIIHERKIHLSFAIASLSLSLSTPTHSCHRNYTKEWIEQEEEERGSRGKKSKVKWHFTTMMCWSFIRGERIWHQSQSKRKPFVCMRQWFYKCIFASFQRIKFYCEAKIMSTWGWCNEWEQLQLAGNASILAPIHTHTQSHKTQFVRFVFVFITLTDIGHRIVILRSRKNCDDVCEKALLLLLLSSAHMSHREGEMERFHRIGLTWNAMQRKVRRKN